MKPKRNKKHIDIHDVMYDYEGQVYSEVFDGMEARLDIITGAVRVDSRTADDHERIFPLSTLADEYIKHMDQDCADVQLKLAKFLKQFANRIESKVKSYPSPASTTP